MVGPLTPGDSNWLIVREVLECPCSRRVFGIEARGLQNYVVPKHISLFSNMVQD